MTRIGYTRQYPRHRYKRLNDPGPNVSLILKERTPCPEYRKLVIGEISCSMHCSYAGALRLIEKYLGLGNFHQDRMIVSINVPEGNKGAWIGKNGSIAGFLKQMFCATKLTIVGDKNWRYRDTDDNFTPPSEP